MTLPVPYKLHFKAINDVGNGGYLEVADAIAEGDIYYLSPTPSPKGIKIPSNNPLNISIATISPALNGGAGFKFLFTLNNDTFYFYIRLVSGEVRLGLSNQSINEAKAQAKSARTTLGMGPVKAWADIKGNIGTVAFTFA